MQTVSLTWQHAMEVSAVVGGAGGVLAVLPDRRAKFAGAFLREAAVIGVLYALWGLAGQLSSTGVDDAFRRARWIRHAEHDVHLPSEASVQHLILGHPLVVQAVNIYYATMHFPMMFVFLIWLFVRHRPQYRPVRQVLAWTTLGCLLVQLMAVAPPRLLRGIVDTGLLYNQSVYNRFTADQLSAMPSVHVGWAVFVGYYSWRVGRSRWRYLGAAHAVVTVFVVVASGNHWWADGIVAVAILAIVAWLVAGVRALFRAGLRAAQALLQGPATSTTSVGAPEGEPVAVH